MMQFGSTTPILHVHDLTHALLATPTNPRVTSRLIEDVASTISKEVDLKDRVDNV